MTNLKNLRITNTEVCLSALVYRFHKEKKELNISSIVNEYIKIFGKRCNKKVLIKRIKEFNEKGLFEFKYKKARYGSIPKYIEITDKFLIFYKLLMLNVFLISDEDMFNKNAIEELGRILNYLKVKKIGKN